MQTHGIQPLKLHSSHAWANLNIGDIGGASDLNERLVLQLS
jgi:hypothetical protein